MSGHHHAGDLISRGFQGAVYKQDADGQSDSRYIIVKRAMGSPLARMLRRAMIRREYRVYQCLEGIAGIPVCHGLRDGNDLILEYIEGPSLREVAKELPDRETFYSALLQLVLAMHQAGVAHADMKRKDNILVSPDGQPYLIDFGSAVLRKKNSPFWNRLAFQQACRIDLNAWVKLKYQRQNENISAEDLHYYRPTFAEKWARRLRRTWRKITGRQWRNARRRRRSSG